MVIILIQIDEDKDKKIEDFISPKNKDFISIIVAPEI